MYCFYAWFKPNHKHYLKQAKSLDDSCPLLFLVRDPISRLKSAINHGNTIGKSSFCMGDNLSSVLDKVRYFDSKEIQSQSLIKIWQNYDFRDNTMLSWFANKEVYYLDMQEIMPNHAFETMKRLSEKLGFNAPEQEQSYLFERIFWDSSLKHLLPLSLEINCNQKRLFIFISMCGIINQPTEFLLNDKLKPHPLLELIYLQINQESFEILYRNQAKYQEVLSYLNQFILALDAKIKQEKAKQWKEQDVLEYLKTNPVLRKEIKQTLDQELVHIKSHRPDIVESWQYYQAFEKMCAEMD